VEFNKNKKGIDSFSFVRYRLSIYGFSILKLYVSD